MGDFFWRVRVEMGIGMGIGCLRQVSLSILSWD